LAAENRLCKKNSGHVFSILFGGNAENTVQIFFLPGFIPVPEWFTPEFLQLKLI
jgi:hypothetical protein